MALVLVSDNNYGKHDMNFEDPSFRRCDWVSCPAFVEPNQQCNMHMYEIFSSLSPQLGQERRRL